MTHCSFRVQCQQRLCTSDRNKDGNCHINRETTNTAENKRVGYVSARMVTALQLSSSNSMMRLSCLHLCNQFLITSATVECYSQDRKDTTLIPLIATASLPAQCRPAQCGRNLKSCRHRDTGRQQCARLSTTNARTARCQLKLHQQRQMVRWYLGVRAAMHMVLLEP